MQPWRQRRLTSWWGRCTVLYCTVLYCTLLQVGEVEHGAGHRLGVNVVTADRVANTVVPEEKVGRPAPS